VRSEKLITAGIYNIYWGLTLKLQMDGLMCFYYVWKRVLNLGNYMGG